MEEDDRLRENAVEHGKGQSQEDASEPDVKLEVPRLKVEEIELKVDDLKGKVSLSANLVKFVQIDAGADVQLETVELQMKGLEVEAQLKVRLERVRQILQRTMETIDRNPEMLKALLKPVAQAPGQAAEKVAAADE